MFESDYSEKLFQFQNDHDVIQIFYSIIKIPLKNQVKGTMTQL